MTKSARMIHAALLAFVAVSCGTHLLAAEEGSPLSFRIGGADFTPGGFLDFTSFYRNTNVASGIGTTFGTIPYGNATQGNISETRFTVQNSRLSLKATDKFGDNNVTGYVEADFLGSQPANAFVTSNSDPLRLRLYFLDLKRSKWEFLAGQAWSWLTPNRVGLSPDPADIFYTKNVDTNYQVGLTWTRAAQIRAAYHPDDNWSFGLALENPEQFVGAGEVIFPFAINAQLGTQFDAANQTGIPNLFPDIIPKMAYDTDINGKHFHVEGVGLLRGFKQTHSTLPGDNGKFHSDTQLGEGFALNTNLELFKGVNLITDAYWSSGGGRYIFGLAPDLVIGPDGHISPVHSYAGLAGIEAQVTSQDLLASYYGVMYAQRNSFGDTTSPLANPPTIGFGGTNSPNGANRNIQEITFDWIHTFWKNPQHGAVQLLTQYSYVQRNPWFTASGGEGTARTTMFYADIRYILP